LDLPASRFLASGKIVCKWRGNFTPINSESAGFSTGAFLFPQLPTAETPRGIVSVPLPVVK
jgi:hypothetical protein